MQKYFDFLYPKSLVRTIKSYVLQKSTTEDRMIPWMPWSVVHWLAKTLHPEMRVFEWGSGGSTIYMAERVATVVSVEHDAKWVTLTKKQSKLHNLSNITFVHQPFETGKELSVYSSGHVEHQGEDYEKYCKSIEQFENQSFDLIVVDGRARMGCVHVAKNKVKVGGYLLVDDTERARYQEQLAQLHNFDRIELGGAGRDLYHAHKTSIFTRKF